MILVFGKTGQVGIELQRNFKVKALHRNEADLANPQNCFDTIVAHKPNAVINAAAYTAVDNAEGQEALATVINGNAPKEMARACSLLGIPLVQISTDYVFDGTSKKLWLPDDENLPQNAYGRSKLAGELEVRASGAVYAILRTSWVVSANGKNFVKTMLNLSDAHDTLHVVADQIGGPTPACDIATACMQIASQLIQDPLKSGTYHFSGQPDVSWADFAIEIFEQAKKATIVKPITSENYPTLATRPLHSRLDCSATEQIFGIKRPSWKNSLTTILKDLEYI